MAKKGMKRVYIEKEHNSVKPVPEIQGKAKSGKKHANDMHLSDFLPVLNAEHAVPQIEEKALPPEYPVFDNDLAVENIRSDSDHTAADLQDFRE